MILGSSSARRLELLKNIRIVPDVVAAADIDETPRKLETPVKYVQRMALEKNAALADKFPNDFLITADTTGVMGRRIIGKPADQKEQEKFLRQFSGRSHQILTAVAVRAPNGKTVHRVVKTRVSLKRLSDEEITGFVATNEWVGIGCGYQFGLYIDRFITSVNGSVSGVIGLPLFETIQLLKGLGYDENRN